MFCRLRPAPRRGPAWSLRWLVMLEDLDPPRPASPAAPRPAASPRSAQLIMARMPRLCEVVGNVTSSSAIRAALRPCLRHCASAWPRACCGLSSPSPPPTSGRGEAASLLDPESEQGERGRRGRGNERPGPPRAQQARRSDEVAGRRNSRCEP